MRGFIDLSVRDAMTHGVTTVAPTTTVAELEALVERTDFNSYPVVDGDRVVGIVTKFDLLRNFIFTPASVIPHYTTLRERRVRDLMQTEVVSVRPDTPLTRVLQVMVDMKTKSLPVLSDGRLVGIISREDILRALRRAVAAE